MLTLIAKFHWMEIHNTLWPEGLCQLLTSWQRHSGRNVLLLYLSTAVYWPSSEVRYCLSWCGYSSQSWGKGHPEVILGRVAASKHSSSCSHFSTSSPAAYLIGSFSDTSLNTRPTQVEWTCNDHERIRCRECGCTRNDALHRTLNNWNYTTLT